MKILGKIGAVFGDSNERVLKRVWPLAARINALEPEFQRLSNDQLRAKTEEFRGRLAGGETLNRLLPEAFAAVRETATRTLDQRPFDAQLLGGIVLHQGKIAEMKTGEGKTLAATLAVYLNALEGSGVHIVTVNDYLAKRDTQWMGPIYHLLGLEVSSLQDQTAYMYDPQVEGENPSLGNLRPVSRREAYAADITYGTNHEFGFDYLRDNMVQDRSQMVQRDASYAIVDEVDNILIDEARTPLIISGPAQQSTRLYATFARLVPRMQRDVDYTLDEKLQSVVLTEEGINKLERWLNISNLYDPANYVLTHYVENALKAHVLFQLDRNYVVREGEVIIVDEFTGRLMQGRRYSEGLHQAIEAKEGLEVQRESTTYATITLQNYFRLYPKLAGMTGTALTEAEEFFKIYKLDVVAVPTNLPMIRHDEADLVYKTQAAKFRATVVEIQRLHQEGRPVLVGTTSIDTSERLSEMLRRGGTPHNVLNAKQHEREATIVAQAGRRGAVTVATNMAGRGTDIILGGSPDGHTPQQWQQEHDAVVALGGLHTLGTERHEARRIDNQLRGRAGRQGDPGSSQFFVSLEDDLMRRFGGERVKGIMDWAGMDEDIPMKQPMLSKVIGSAQVKVEGQNFDIRKHLVEYDDVINNHRDIIYGERRKILSGADLKGNIQEMLSKEIEELVANHASDRDPEERTLDTLESELLAIMPLPPELRADPLEELSQEDIQEALVSHADVLYQEREQELGAEAMRRLERDLMLRIIDAHWVDHLTAMQDLRQGIGLQAYGQRDPLVMYKREAHEMFGGLLRRIQHDIVHTLFHLVPLSSTSSSPPFGASQGPGRPALRAARGAMISPSQPTVMANALSQRRTSVAQGQGGRKVGRNDPCPCGSGKKYKRCHGVAA